MAWKAVEEQSPRPGSISDPSSSGRHGEEGRESTGFWGQANEEPKSGFTIRWRRDMKS